MAWDSHFEELVRFHGRHGHVLVPVHYSANPELPLWLAAQKTGLANLTRTQVRQLWDVGVRFPTWESRWLFQFFKLVEGEERFGNVNDARIWVDDPSLKVWIGTQRILRGRRLASHRWRWLDEIGFIWNLDEAAWEGRFEEWRTYVRDFGSMVACGRRGKKAFFPWSEFENSMACLNGLHTGNDLPPVEGFVNASRVLSLSNLIKLGDSG